LHTQTSSRQLHALANKLPSAKECLDDARIGTGRGSDALAGERLDHKRCRHGCRPIEINATRKLRHSTHQHKNLDDGDVDGSTASVNEFVGMHASGSTTKSCNHHHPT
jgi:hypothetical protein